MRRVAPVYKACRLPQRCRWKSSLERLGGAVAFGAAIGWEREWRQKPAGLRTHMLVALGAAGFVLVALRLASDAATAELQLSDMIQGVTAATGALALGLAITGLALFVLVVLGAVTARANEL